MQYSITDEIAQIELLIIKGKFKEALQELNLLEEETNLNDYKQLSCNILRSIILFHLGFYKKSLKIAENACDKSEQLTDDMHLFDAYIAKNNVLVRYVWVDKALILITKCEEILKNLSHMPTIELKKRQAKLADTKVWIYSLQNKKNKVIENLKLGLKLREENGNKFEIAMATFSMGMVSWYFEGDLDKSLKITNEAFELAKEIDYKFLISLVHFRLGGIYDIMGDLDRSLEYQKRSLELSKEIQHKLGISMSLHFLGIIYEKKGDLDRALEYYKEALKVKEEMGDMWGITTILDNLFWMSFNKNDFGDANQYFKRMKQLEETGHFIINDLLLRLDKALLLRTSSIPSKKAKSKEILKDVIEKSPLFEVTTRALLNLCDLLLCELRETNNLKLLNEIQIYLNRLIIISKNQPSYSLLSESYLLKAKLELLTLDLQNAQESISKAQEIAEKYDLIQIIKRISIEKENLITQTNKWESLKQSNSTIAELIDLSLINNQLVRMLRRRYFSKGV